MGISANLRHEAQRDVVVLSGRLTGRDTDRCLAHIQELVGYQNISLTLDISALDFVDSSGLGFLVQLNNDLTASGKSLILINTSTAPGHYVRELINMTGLSKVLNIESTN